MATTITGALHAHSTYSYDGKESLQSLKEFLLSKGVAFCCMTEHTDHLSLEKAQQFIQECKALSGSQFVFIPGFEVPYKNAHILLVGTESFLGQEATSEMLRSWSDKSVLTVLAHPVRNNFKIDDTIENSIDAVEIWNQQYEGKKVPRQHSAKLLRQLQENNPALLATGGLDFHRREHFGAPLFTLDVERVTADDILKALKNGEYTFGSKTVAVSSNGLWKGKDSLIHKVQSFNSIGTITLGKKTNALLTLFGLSLPKGLKKFIRSRV